MSLFFLNIFWNYMYSGSVVILVFISIFFLRFYDFSLSFWICPDNVFFLLVFFHIDILILFLRFSDYILDISRVWYVFFIFFPYRFFPFIYDFSTIFFYVPTVCFFSFFFSYRFFSLILRFYEYILDMSR